MTNPPLPLFPPPRRAVPARLASRQLSPRALTTQGLSATGTLTAAVTQAARFWQVAMVIGGAALAGISTAYATDSALLIEDAVIMQPPPGLSVSAAMMKLSNTQDRPVHVTAASSDKVGRIEIHETRIVDDVASMAAVDRVTVPAGGTVFFRHGGLHLMIFDPAEPLKPGVCIPISLSTSQGDVAAGFIVVRQGKDGDHGSNMQQGDDKAHGHDMKTADDTTQNAHNMKEGHGKTHDEHSMTDGHDATADGHTMNHDDGGQAMAASVC